jgi:O-antigen ligase
MNCSSYSTHSKVALASLLLVGLIAIIPFLLPYHALPLPAFYSEWAAFALGVAACFPLLSRNFWLHLKIPHSAIWLFAVVVLIALQALFVDHVYVTQSLLPGIYISWAAILIILCTWIREQLGLDRAVTVFAWMILIGGTLQALAGLVQYFNVSGELASMVEMKQGISIHGNINQRNHFATQITLTAFALIYLRATDRMNRTLTTALLILFAFVITVSSSRTTAVYIIAGFLLSLLSYRASRTTVHYRLVQGTGLFLVLFLLAQFFLPFLNDWLKHLFNAMGFDVGGLEALAALQRGAAEGIDVRISEWLKAWLIFMEAPFWGIGIGHYGWYSFNYQALPEFSTISKPVTFQHSHNLIMQMLAELGVVGFLLLLFMTFAWARQMLPHWKDTSYWLILTLIIVLLLHSSVEYPLWYSFFLGLAAILLGLGNENAIKIRFTPWLGQFTAGATLLLSGAILAITFLGFQDISQVNRLVFSTTPQQASATLHAISKNPLLTPWAEAAIAQHGAPDRNTLDQQLAMTTRVAQYRPSPINVNRQIIYLALTGKSIEASDLLKKAFIVYPEDFSKLACYWKVAPAGEVQRLWEEAEKLTGGTIECQTKTKTPAGPS